VSDPLRLGLIGCGRLAEQGYVPALAGIGGVDLVATADPDPARRAAPAAAARGRLAEFDSAAALAATEVVDAAIVASPAASHLADATALAAAGIPCLVEKPPAEDLAGASMLAALTPSPRIGFNRRFTHGLRLRGAVPASGEIELDLELRYRRASWGAVAVGDPAVLDLAPHLVDLTLWLTGEVEATVVSARLSHERAEIDLALERGSARIRCACDRSHRERVTVRAGGRTVANSAEGGPAAFVTGRLPGREHPLIASLRTQLEAFASTVRGVESAVLANAGDGVRAMRVIDAAREAAS
jgi:predicted dehydrogenase